MAVAKNLGLQRGGYQHVKGQHAGAHREDPQGGASIPLACFARRCRRLRLGCAGATLGVEYCEKLIFIHGFFSECKHGAVALPCTGQAGRWNGLNAGL